MLGAPHAQPVPGRPPCTGVLAVSPGVGVISRGSQAVGGVPLSPRGQRLMHGDSVSLHLTLQAVHLLSGDEGDKGGNAVKEGSGETASSLRWPSPHRKRTSSWGHRWGHGTPNAPLHCAGAKGPRGCTHGFLRRRSREERPGSAAGGSTLATPSEHWLMRRATGSGSLSSRQLLTHHFREACMWGRGPPRT